ncbi:MAG: hypothetical protein ACR2MO_02090 [Acidimicrobiales bacterium]
MTSIALVITAACSGDDTAVKAGDTDDETTTTVAPPPTTKPPSSAAALVLQIRTGGGFVPPESVFGEIPEFSVYADGRVFVTGPTTMEFPGAALPNLLVGTIPAADVQDAVKAFKDAGVGQSADLGRPLVADAPTTTFTLVDGGRTSTLDAYALGFDDAPTMSPAQKENRRRLNDLIQQMHKLGAAANGPYKAAAVSVLVRPYTEPDSGPAPGQATWPLADLGTGGKEQLGGRCLGFTGADAERVLAAAGAARSNTRWRSGAGTWALSFRPELPGSQPCADR